MTDVLTLRYPTRKEVETCNLNRLNSIDAIAHEYKAVDRPGYDENGKQYPYEKMHKLLDKQLIAPKLITLKVVCPVSSALFN